MVKIETEHEASQITENKHTFIFHRVKICVSIGVSREGGSGGPDPPLFLDPPFSSVTLRSHPTRSHRQM